MMQTDSRAEEIAEDLLYRTGQALMSGDFRWLDDCFALPQMLETLDGKRLVETEEDVREVIASVRQFHSANGVTELVRTTVSSHFLRHDMIGTTHVSCMLRKDGSVLGKPYPSYSILRDFDGVWKIVSSMYAVLDAPELNDALVRKGIAIDG